MVDTRWTRWKYLPGCGVRLTLQITKKLETLGGEELTEGFVAGFALCIVAVFFGMTGAICIGKFLSGFGEEYQVHELLIKLSERLEKRD